MMLMLPTSLDGKSGENICVGGVGLSACVCVCVCLRAMSIRLASKN